MFALIQEDTVQSAPQTVSPPPIENIRKTPLSNPVPGKPKRIRRTFWVPFFLAMLLGSLILPSIFFRGSNGDRQKENIQKPIAGVGVNQDVEKEPVNQRNEVGQAGLGKEVGNAIGNLLGLMQPSISSMSMFRSHRWPSREYFYGYDLMITIENPTNQAIESMQFMLQNRTDGRTVANEKDVVGGFIPGGVEKNSSEEINIFVMNRQIGLQNGDGDKLPKGDFLEIAIQKVQYANGEAIDLSKNLFFVRGIETAPDEEHIMNQRRNMPEWKMRGAMQDFFEKGIQQP
jgi:hypothetical protein